MVKLIVRMNHEDKASIMTGTFPKVTVPSRIVPYSLPKSPFTAKKLLIRPIIITVEIATIPLFFVLNKRTPITADNNMSIIRLINARRLKLFQ